MKRISAAQVLEHLATVYNPPTRIICAVDAVEQVGVVAREYGQSVLLVTDPGLVAAGHAAQVHGLLAAAGLRVARFDHVKENPTTECVEVCLQSARSAETQVFVALGGGSAIDTAKACNMLLTNGGRVSDYWGVGKVPGPMQPLIAIPTTAGTGSEMQSAALIADAQTHQKMACLDPKAAARVAILDPALSISQPPKVTANTGIDAIAHALEALVTRKRNAISNLYSSEALKLGLKAFPVVLAEPENLCARAEMLLAAALAGTAIENSMLGAAHSAANPLTAHFGLVHGQAVGLMMPHVLRFNAQQPATKQLYAEVARQLHLADFAHGPDLALTTLVARLDELLNLAGFPRSLAEAGVERSAIPTLAAEAARQWTAQFNPVPVGPGEFISLYEAACATRGSGHFA